ncbi:MAG: protein kinase [Gammaproteobacteria bacterium]|nr:protein kinase [Gammaproteobacteria bacterium]
MRLLYIEEDPKSRARIRHHLSCRWPDVEISSWAPLQRGALPPEFLAQGYDAVLLAHSWLGGDGLDWLRDLAARPGFAPVIFLADRDSVRVREAAQAWGAFAVLTKERIAHEALLDAVERAGQQHRRQLADWRVSPEAEEARRFGDARIPGYRRARLLARGSVSQLYIAESEKAGALVVLKVTPSQRNASGVDQVFDRFLQEYEITTKVRHPNVVRLYELGVADDHAYLAMEYFPLGDLRRRMRSGLAPAEALGIAAQIARVLVAIHAAGVLHRDLKPGNVMMRTEEQVALIDFGLAKHLALDLELTDTGLIFGTPHYMSPEQGHGQPLDARSDLYSLGIVLYEMLAGSKPYTADNPMAVLYMHRNAPLPLLSDSLASLQPLLDALLAKAASERIPDAATAARRIEAARSEWLARVALA